MSGARRRFGDLFNHIHGQAFACGLEAERISRRLRRLSEEAHRTRMSRAAVLIEIAAQVVELEGQINMRAEGPGRG